MYGRDGKGLEIQLKTEQLRIFFNLQWKTQKLFQARDRVYIKKNYVSLSSQNNSECRK
jgi:hypothetical protein